MLTKKKKHCFCFACMSSCGWIHDLSASAFWANSSSKCLKDLRLQSSIKRMRSKYHVEESFPLSRKCMAEKLCWVRGGSVSSSVLSLFAGAVTYICDKSHLVTREQKPSLQVENLINE